MIHSIQSVTKLDQWYSTADPWGYEHHPDDQKRKKLLLGELPEKEYRSVLDIGCGNGFITRYLPGENVTGVDLSEEAIRYARLHQVQNQRYLVGSVFNLVPLLSGFTFDLIVITGVLYPQYVGHANSLVYLIIDQLLENGGIIASVHIDEWATARFPYLLLKSTIYDYRQFLHRMEIYVK